MSYHQGSVWPLFTGWASLAEYRGGQPLAGYQMLMENANLTRFEDLGSDTELLSGDFYVPFGRSTSHQLWSSAMVITPTLRGLFGISIDAETKTITVNPHVPADWDHAHINNLRVGADIVDLTFVQPEQAKLTVSIETQSKAAIKLISSAPGASVSPAGVLTIPRHPIEFGSGALGTAVPGSRTQSARVLSEEYGERQVKMVLEGIAGTETVLPFIETEPHLKLTAVGAHVPDANSTRYSVKVMIVDFPPGEGWKTITVTLTW